MAGNYQMHPFYWQKPEYSRRSKFPYMTSITTSCYICGEKVIKKIKPLVWHCWATKTMPAFVHPWLIDDESYYVQVFCAGGCSIHSLFLSSFPLKRVSTAKKTLANKQLINEWRRLFTKHCFYFKKITKHDPHRSPLVSVLGWFLYTSEKKKMSYYSTMTPTFS